MNLSQFKPFKQYSFYDDSIYGQIFENVTRRKTRPYCTSFNILKPTGHVMHQQFNIQQLYALPTVYLCVLYLSQNKQRLVPLTA